MKTRIFLVLASALWPLISSSCGGTFTYLTPIGPVSYTTPQLVKPPIIVPEK